LCSVSAFVKERENFDRETISFLRARATLFSAQKKGTFQKNRENALIPVSKKAAEYSPLGAETFAIEFLKPSAPPWNDWKEKG